MSRVLGKLLIGASIFATTGAIADSSQLVDQGRQVFSKWCLPCHGPGNHTPGTMALYFKYNGQEHPLLEHRVGMSSDYLKVMVRKGVSVMPSFRQTEISDQDIEAMAAYLKTSSAMAPLPRKEP